MAVDAVVHLEIDGIAGECYGCDAGMFLVLVVELDVGRGARNGRIGCLPWREVDHKAFGGATLEIDQKHQFVGASVKIKVVKLPRYAGLAGHSD